MPKSKGNGGKNRRRGKTESSGVKKEVAFRTEGHEYARVLAVLGNGRLACECSDGKTRLAHIRGKMRKKVWINMGDIILVSLRDFQNDKCDVVLKYSPEDATFLRKSGQLELDSNNHIYGDFGVEFVDTVHEEGHEATIDDNPGYSEEDSDDDRSQDDELDIDNI